MSRLLKLSLVRLARNAVLIVGLILLFFSGLDLLLGRLVDKDLYGWTIEWIPLAQMDVYPLFALAALSLLLPFVYLLMAMIESRLERGIIGKGTLGEDICLTPEAVERVVTREVKTQAEEVIKVASCEATQGTRGVCVRLRVVVSDRAIVPEVQKKVVRIVRETLTRTIGYGDSSQVGVKVTEIAGAGGVKRAPRPRGGARKRAALTGS